MRALGDVAHTIASEMMFPVDEPIPEIYDTKPSPDATLMGEVPTDLRGLRYRAFLINQQAHRIPNEAMREALLEDARALMHVYMRSVIQRLVNPEQQLLLKQKGSELTICKGWKVYLRYTQPKKILKKKNVQVH